MKRKTVIFSGIIFWISSFSFPAVYTTDEAKIWSALERHVDQLKSENEFLEALSALKGFEKKYPRSSFLPEVWFKTGELLLSHGDVEKGFQYLEQAASKAGRELKPRIEKTMDAHALAVSQTRLERLDFFLEKFFIENISFPASLSSLLSEQRHLSKNLLKDGFGSPFRYELFDSPVFKGKDFLSYHLFSCGPDQTPETRDDIIAEKKKGDEIKDKEALKILDIYKEEDRWNAEVAFFDPQRRSEVSKKIREGDSILDFWVFGIRERGIVLLKDSKPVIIKK